MTQNAFFSIPPHTDRRLRHTFLIVGLVTVGVMWSFYPNQIRDEHRAQIATTKSEAKRIENTILARAERRIERLEAFSVLAKEAYLHHGERGLKDLFVREEGSPDSPIALAIVEGTGRILFEHHFSDTDGAIPPPPIEQWSQTSLESDQTFYSTIVYEPASKRRLILVGQPIQGNHPTIDDWIYVVLDAQKFVETTQIELFGNNLAVGLFGVDSVVIPVVGSFPSNRHVTAQLSKHETRNVDTVPVDNGYEYVSSKLTGLPLGIEVALSKDLPQNQESEIERTDHYLEATLAIIVSYLIFYLLRRQKYVAAALRRNQMRLMIAKSKNGVAQEAKADFLAKISHELRTPLNAVIGFSEMIKNEVLGPVGTPQYIAYGRHIHESGRHLLTLLDGILHMSTIKAGDIILSDETLDLQSSIAWLEFAIRPLTARHKVTLETQVASDMGTICGDEIALRQALFNIVSNAVKYSNAGQVVTVTAGLTDRGDVLITITDAGRGMTRKEIQRALVPFGGGTSMVVRDLDGIGLGIPIAKSLIELHGGNLLIGSTPGVGTVVTILLPHERRISNDIGIARSAVG